jgi:outer membrane receptor protein involved in Fe transport
MSATKALIVITLFIANLSCAQTNYNISGNVSDSALKSLDGVIISLLNHSNLTLLKTAFTDEKGNFEFDQLKPDSFKIAIIHIGYKKYLSPIIVITENDFEKKLSSITLLSDFGVELEEVAIVAKLPFVERKIDRTIINPDALISNAGSNALEVLAKSPGVMVAENGTIKLKGKSGVIVLIDDKPTYLSATDLESYLKSLPASQIKQIELMTNPPAQYDAAGNAGVINIKTKKNKLQGINGNVSLNYAQGRYARSNDNASLNYSNKKITIFSNFSYGNNNSYHDLTIQRTYKNSDLSTKSVFNQNTYIQPSDQSYSVRLGLDYYVTKKTTLGIATKGLLNESTVSQYNLAQLLNADQSLNATVIADNTEKNTFKNGTLNFNVRHEFDSLGKLLTVDADYVNYQTHMYQVFKNDMYLPDNTSIYNDVQNGNLPSNITIYAFKADYSNPFKHEAKLDVGVKTSYTDTDNDAIYTITQSGITYDNYNLSNHFKYNEMINAAYANFSKTYKRLSFQTGLRFESTTLNGNQLGNPVKTGSSFTRNYNNLFPTAYLSYNLDSSSNHNLNLSYGKRVSRPFYKDLNPFSSPLDKYTFYEGNPYLKPTFAHNFSLAYSFKELLTATFSYSKSKDQIQETIEINNGIYYSRPGNIGSSEVYALSLQSSIPVTKWLTSNVYTEVSQSYYKSVLYTETLNSAGIYWYANINNNIQLKKGWSAEINGEYITDFIESQFSFGDFGHISLGVQKKILKDMGSLKFSFRDILHTDKIRGTINNLQLTDANWYGPRDTQVASLTFSYRFGKNLNSKPKHTGSGSEAEQNRVKG